MKKLILFIFMFMALGVKAEQHKIIKEIIANANSCVPLYYFSKSQINSKTNYKFYSEALKDFTKNKNFYLTKDSNLMPVSNCILRANRNYYKNIKTLNENFRVTTVINTDLLIKNLVENKVQKKSTINELYFPMSSSEYPKVQSAKSFIEILKSLSQATPQNRAIITCFFGKHRTGLISASYQFLLEYAQNKEKACKEIATEKDKAYQQMLNIAKIGLLIYDMPDSFKEFYKDFAKSVCEENSKEFLNSLLN